MDPEEALRKAREALAQIRKAQDADFPLETHNLVVAVQGVELADAFEALDEWMKKGGFAPADWQKGFKET